MSVKDISFGYVIPDHDDGGSDDFREHIPQADDVDEEPHDCLIDTKSQKRGEDEEEHLHPCLFFCMKYDIDAEDVIHDQGDGKGDGGGNEWIKTGIFGQCVKEYVFQQETSAAYSKETEDFPKPLHGWKDF